MSSITSPSPNTCYKISKKPESKLKPIAKRTLNTAEIKNQAIAKNVTPQRQY